MSDKSAAAAREESARAVTASRFASQNATTEELLRSQTVGLVQLSDFRKRRAEVLEQRGREAHDGAYGSDGLGSRSGSQTPVEE